MKRGMKTWSLHHKHGYGGDEHDERGNGDDHEPQARAGLAAHDLDVASDQQNSAVASQTSWTIQSGIVLGIVVVGALGTVVLVVSIGFAAVAGKSADKPRRYIMRREPR